jgi:hypothetical protein
MVLPMVGAGITAISNLMSLKANAAQAQFQMGYAQNLAGLLDVRGEQMRAAAGQRSADVGLRYAAQAARERVFGGAGNIAGSSLQNTIASTLALGQLAQRRTIATGESQAQEEFQRAAEQRQYASLEQAAIHQYGAAEPWAVAGPLVAGASTAAGQAMQAQQIGVNPITFQPTAAGGDTASVNPSKWPQGGADQPSADQGYYY